MGSFCLVFLYVLHAALLSCLRSVCVSWKSPVNLWLKVTISRVLQDAWSSCFNMFWSSWEKVNSRVYWSLTTFMFWIIIPDPPLSASGVSTARCQTCSLLQDIWARGPEPDRRVLYQNPPGRFHSGRDLHYQSPHRSASSLNQLCTDRQVERRTEVMT